MRIKCYHAPAFLWATVAAERTGNSNSRFLADGVAAQANIEMSKGGDIGGDEAEYKDATAERERRLKSKRCGERDERMKKHHRREKRSIPTYSSSRTLLLLSSASAIATAALFLMALPLRLIMHKGGDIVVTIGDGVEPRTQMQSARGL